MAITPVSDLATTQLGTDKVTNGDFASAGTWTYGQASGGWAYDGTNDEADCDGSQTEGVDLEQDISAVATEIYLLQYTISNWVAGEVTPQIGGVDGVAHGADGTWETYITATGTGNLKFQADSDFNGTIDDVSAKKVLFPTEDTVRITWTNPQGYDSIRVWRHDGSRWWSIETLAGNATSYDDEDVTANFLYLYKVGTRVETETPPSIFSNTDSAGIWRDTPMASIVIGGSIVEYVTGTDYAETPTAAIGITGYILDAISLKTNYAYYLGDSSGKIYEYGGDYLGDAGGTIPARWESKDTDFSDQDLQISHRSKIIEKMRLHYIDKTEDAVISVSISTDGGASWTPKTKTMGTGDGKAKYEDFYNVTSGHTFRFAIENASASDEFLMVGLEIFFTVGGD